MHQSEVRQDQQTKTKDKNKRDPTPYFIRKTRMQNKNNQGRDGSATSIATVYFFALTIRQSISQSNQIRQSEQTTMKSGMFLLLPVLATMANFLFVLAVISHHIHPTEAANANTNAIANTNVPMLEDL